MNVVKNFVLKVLPQAPFYTVRRSFERKKYIRRYGYENPLLDEGPLPRLKSKEELPKIEPYRPKNAWHEKRALFGQNDYIGTQVCSIWKTGDDLVIEEGLEIQLAAAVNNGSIQH